MIRHFTAALTASLLLSGCMKAGPKKEDLGPAISEQKISDALMAAAAGTSLNTLSVGQTLTFVATRRVENGDSEILLGARKVEIIDRNDKNDENRFTIRIINSQRTDGANFETTVKEDAQRWKKDAISLGGSSLMKMLSARKIKGFASSEVAVTKAGKVTFHHFKESDGIIDPPPAVKSRDGCEGLSPCQINVHYVQFEMVIWQDEENYQKISVDFAFNKQTPYIPFGTDLDSLTGSLIIDCRSTYVPVNDRTVYVRDCLTLDDFER